MSDESLHNKMREHDEIAEKEEQFRRKKLSLLDDVTEELIDVVEGAASQSGVRAEVTNVNDTGETYTIQPRFDSADLIAGLSEALPPGFVVDTFKEDGSIKVMWIESTEEPDGFNTQILLKAIISEETAEDGYLTEEALTWDEVVKRAQEIGVPEEEAHRKLHRMDDMNVITVHEDQRVVRGEYF